MVRLFDIFFFKVKIYFVINMYIKMIDILKLFNLIEMNCDDFVC